MKTLTKTGIVLIIFLISSSPLLAQQKASDASFKVGNKTVQLSHFHGKKRVLWLFSTWCPSCAVALQELAKKQPKLLKSGLHIIALRNYNNGGYPKLGGTINMFIKKYLKKPGLLKAKNWTFGEASKKLESKYNPHHRPDIFFLINKKGNIVEKGNALGIHMDMIMAFAKGTPTTN